MPGFEKWASTVFISAEGPILWGVWWHAALVFYSYKTEMEKYCIILNGIEFMDINLILKTSQEPIGKWKTQEIIFSEKFAAFKAQLNSQAMQSKSKYRTKTLSKSGCPEDVHLAKTLAAEQQ